MNAELKQILPQEGTNDVGESLPDASASGCPTYSGEGKDSQNNYTEGPDWTSNGGNVLYERRELSTQTWTGFRGRVRGRGRLRGRRGFRGRGMVMRRPVTFTNRTPSTTATSGYTYKLPVRATAALPSTTASKPVERKPSGAEKRKRRKEEQRKLAQGDDITTSIASRPTPNLHAAQSKLSTVPCASSGCKLAVVAENYPGTYIEVEDLRQFQQLITERLEDAPDPLPIFTVGHITMGAIEVHCSDEHAAQWVRNSVGGLVLGGARLKVLAAGELPKPIKMAYRSRNMALMDNARALRMLQRFTPSLRTNDWKVVSTLVEEQHIRRIVLMDRASAEVIANAGYVLPGGLEYCSFKLLDEFERRNEAPGDFQGEGLGNGPVDHQDPGMDWVEEQ